MQNKPSTDPGFLAPIVLGVLSILGIAVVFSVGRTNSARPSSEMVSTATSFRYIYLGTEPGLSTLTPEPTDTPIYFEPPASTEVPDNNDIPRTYTPTALVFPTQSFIRTPLPTATNTLAAILKKIDDTYYEILYDGSWTSQTNVTDAFQNTLHISYTIENRAAYTFVGQQIIISYQAGPSLGEIMIDLDGSEFVVSQSSSQTELKDWASPSLLMGTHEITIIHLSGGSINIDSIIIPDLSTPAPTTPTP